MGDFCSFYTGSKMPQMAITVINIIYNNGGEMGQNCLFAFHILGISASGI